MLKAMIFAMPSSPFYMLQLNHTLMDSTAQKENSLDDPTSTRTDLFTRFQQRLSAVGGETHQVASLEEVASFIAAHPALAAGELVIPPIGNGEAALPPWGTLLPTLRDKGVITHQAESPTSVADAAAGLSCADLPLRTDYAPSTDIVTYHDSCQSCNCLGLRDQARRVIRDGLGLELREM